MRVATNCPNCANRFEIECPTVATHEPPRGATAVQWVVGLFFLTLATATLGTYLGIRIFIYDIGSRMKDERPAIIGGR